ncbi:DUF998 domain-containing protein [Microbacterium sp.]|uniref:DUF998 domain-containing protein n=1 Tax=Microbacterium sp. TaxID=51671 RepID=UPI003A844B1A
MTSVDHTFRPAAASSSERRRESVSIALAGISLVVVAAIAIPVLGFRAAPIAGPGSVGQFAAISSAVVAAVVFVLGRWSVRDRSRSIGLFDLLDTLALTIAHAVVALLTWTLLADILARGFIDADVFPVAAILLSGGLAAITAYAVSFIATHLDLLTFAAVLALFLVEGVLAATLTSSDPHWWTMNLSALGMTDDLSARTFNLTVIVAGFLVTTLARHSTASLPSAKPNGVRWLRVCLVVLGICLMIVGLFPVDDFFLLHTGFASGMVLVFLIVVVLLPRWVPGMPAAFIVLSYVLVGVVLIATVQFIAGGYTLTAVELVGGLMVFTWLILFIRNAAALTADADT